MLALLTLTKWYVFTLGKKDNNMIYRIKHDDNDPVWWIIGDVLRWLWRVFLPEFIFCVVFMILVAFVWLVIGYRG